jgi:diacylglycerol kinase
MGSFSLGKRLESFTHAVRGAETLVRTQHNARIHLVVTGLVVVNAVLLRIDAVDWALVTIAVAGVWITEAINTAVELLADELTLERRPRIRDAKDMAAFAVLAASVLAAVLGVIVFGPCLVR